MKIYFSLFSAFVLFLFWGCGGQKDYTRDFSKHKIKIITTTGMIADAAKNVGGERVSVTPLMGPGVDPHLYKASEGDVSRMAGADLILYNGLHLEGKMTDIFARMQQRIKTVAVAEAIPQDSLLAPPQFKGAHDPHVWFDVRLWKIVVTRIRDALVEMDSTHAQEYQERAKNYLARLDSLDRYVLRQALRVPKRQRVLITAHDAFNYFGRRYHFEVRGLQGISTASEAGTADIQRLADFIKERQIPAVFVETSVPQRYIEALQAAVHSRGFDVKIGGSLFSDAMGQPGTPEGEYLGMVKHNIDIIVSALLKN
ncbi:metal ABC transporter solute-binding protein, Zn/Mn family [Caldithrix abyssi]